MSPAQRPVDLAALALCTAAAMLGTGCFGAQAKAVVVPALDMPAPPPRVVEVSTPVPPPPVSLPEEPVRNTPPREQPAAEPPRAVDGARSDAPPEPARAAGAARPAPGALQTTSAREEAEAEQRIRSSLVQAVTALNRIGYQSLDADARLQYDTARRFIVQAEDAIRARNLVFAANLADKAVLLAAQLAGR
jgi:hypothetical protein